MPTPSGVACGCGCGRMTHLAPATVRSRGWKKGHPLLFCKGHRISKFNNLPDYIVSECGFETACWLWQKAKTVEGYGRLRVSPTFQDFAHREFFRQAGRIIPDGHHLDHLCRNRACVNPDHLEAVTHVENCRRGLQAKVKHGDVAVIRDLVGHGRKQREVARMYEIDQAEVSRIVSGKRWSSFLR